jgi:hypothetical protein
MHLKGGSGIRNRDLMEHIHVGSKRAFSKIIKKTFRLDVVKRAVEFSIGLEKMSERTLWRGWPPPK